MEVEEVWLDRRRVAGHRFATMTVAVDVGVVLEGQALESPSPAATDRDLWFAEAVRSAGHCSAWEAVEVSLLQAAMVVEAGPGVDCISLPKWMYHIDQRNRRKRRS